MTEPNNFNIQCYFGFPRNVEKQQAFIVASLRFPFRLVSDLFTFRLVSDLFTTFKLVE